MSLELTRYLNSLLSMDSPLNILKKYLQQMYNYNLNIMSKIVVKHNTDFRKIYKLILNGNWTRDNMLIYNKVI